MLVFKACQRSYVWLIKHGQLSHWQWSITLRALKTKTKHTAAGRQQARRRKNHSFNKEIK
jgi:hypothetical protein